MQKINCLMAILSVLMLLLVSNLKISEALQLSSIEKTYEKGLRAYTSERWSECIVQFEESLHLYKLYKTIVINCRLNCNSHNFDSVVQDNIEELKTFEKYFNRRNCLTKCLEIGFDDVHIFSDLSKNILFSMYARKPYDYLHLCYFQMYALPKAASAAFTYLVANPDDESMKNNLLYYTEQPEVDPNEVVDLESEEFEVLYKLGLKVYQQNKWAETIAAMEEVLTDFMAWENRCRVECEHQPEQDQTSEYVLTVANNMASLLQCQQLCQDKLKLLNYDSGTEFIADILNYLQISYYHTDKFEEAAKAAASYLFLMPSDEDMLENKNIYSTLVNKEAFIERSDVVYYYKRDDYEKKLLNFFHLGKNNDSNSVTKK